jgi:hypothetical protein
VKIIQSLLGKLTICLHIKLKTLSTIIMMIKFATFVALALGAAAQQSGGAGLRGLKSTDKNSITVVESLEEPMNDNTALEVFDPTDLQGTQNENERHLSGWCYDFYPGAIRTSSHHDAKGFEGTDYHLYKHKSESWCKSYCSSYSWCKAYEYYHHESHCELWKGWYGYYKHENGFKSYVKKHC